jgi:hypothetical protein
MRESSKSAMVLIGMALGWQIAAHMLVGDGLRGPIENVDLNTLFRVSAPLVEKGQGGVAMLGLLSAVFAYRAKSSRFNVVALGALALIALADRLLVLPYWYDTLIHADLNLGRPLERVRNGELALAVHQALVSVLVIGWIFIVARSVLTGRNSASNSELSITGANSGAGG